MSVYQLGDVIGRGATGVVHRSQDPTSGRLLAVKVLHPHLVEDAKATSRFIQERHVLSRVSHPNVVQVVELVAEGEQLSIVMELVDGGDLKALHQRARPLPSEAVTMVARIADALAALHAAGVVHRDLKPANVLIQETGEGPVPKITDFGLSRLVEEGMSQSSAAVGTPLYMAPEAVERASTAGPPADVYALGIMLYELLIGTPPFVGGGTMAILRAHSAEVPPTVEGVPAELQGLVGRMLAKDPSVRPAAAEVRDRLKALVGSMDDTSPPRAVRAERAESETVTQMRPPAVSAGSSPASFSPLLRVALPERRIGPWPAERVLIAGATALAALVLAGVLVAVKVTGGSEVNPDAFSFAFDPTLVGESGIATRHWSMSSDGKVLTGDLLVSNGGGEPLTLDYVEVLPESVVADIADVNFEPRPAELLADDRAALLEIDAVDPGARTAFRYTIELEPGAASLERLTALAHDQRAAEKAFYDKQENADRQEPETLDITSLTVTPASLTLDVGDEQDLVLTGTLADGSPAPAEALSAAAWSTGDPSIAAIVDGHVTALGPGATILTAQVGDSSQPVPLLVNPPTAEIVAGPSVQSAAGGAPSGGGGATGGAGTGTGTGAGTGTGTGVGTGSGTGAGTGTGTGVGTGSGTGTGTGTGTDPTEPRGPVAPGAPGTISVSRTGLNSVSLTWSAPADDGGAAVDGYEVRYQGGSSRSASGTTISWDGLAYATTYRFEGRAHNSAGWGPWGGLSAAHLTAQAPGKPVLSIPTATKISDTSAYISFSSSTCTTAEYSLLGTDVGHRSPGWPNAWENLVTCWFDHGWTFTGLLPGTTYTVAIDVHDTGGGTYKTNNIQFTTTGVATVIDAKTDLAISAITETSFTVTATASKCSVMQVSILTTDISASNGPACGTSFTHTFDGLTPGTSYFVTLLGKASNGGTLPGAGASVTTKGGTVITPAPVTSTSRP